LEKTKFLPTSPILRQKRENEQEENQNQISGVKKVPIKMNIAKIVLRSSAPQVVKSITLKSKRAELFADESVQKLNEQSFEKNVTPSQRKCTPPSFEDNLTTASNTTFSR
jgi:hypothetical protein